MTHSNDGGQSRRSFLRSAAVGGLAAGAFAAVSFAQDAAEPAATFALGGEVDGWQGVAPQEIADTTNPTLPLTAGETYRVIWQNLDGQPHNFAVLDGQGNPLPLIQPLEIDAAAVSGVFNGTTNITDVNVTAAVNETNVTGNVTGNVTDNATGNATVAGLVEVTEIVSEQGAVQALEFEATEEIAEYYCQVHPTTMRGDVSLEAGMAGNATNNSTG